MPSAQEEIADPRGMSKKLIWVAAALGILTVAVFIWLAVVSPRNDCNASTVPPLLALQNARSVSDLFAVIGNIDSPCHFVLRMELGHLAIADLLVFIPIYTGFLACLIFMFRKTHALSVYLLITLLLVTVTGDVVETNAQLEIINEWPQTDAFLSRLAIGNNVKIIGLAMLMLGLAFLIGSDGRRSSRVFAIAVGICAGARLIGFAVPATGSLVPLSSLAAYIALAIYCIMRVARGTSLKAAD